MSCLGPSRQGVSHGSGKRCSGLDLPGSDRWPGYAAQLSHFKIWEMAYSSLVHLEWQSSAATLGLFPINHPHRNSRGTDPDCFEERSLGSFPLNHKLIVSGCKRGSSEFLFPYRDGRFQDPFMPSGVDQSVAEPISVKPLPCSPVTPETRSSLESASNSVASLLSSEADWARFGGSTDGRHPPRPAARSALTIRPLLQQS